MTKNELVKTAMSYLVSGIRKDQYENAVNGVNVYEVGKSTEDLVNDVEDKDKLIELLVERVNTLASGITENFAEKDWDKDVVKVEAVETYHFPHMDEMVLS